MRHELFGSVEAMLVPDGLASITGHRVIDVRLQPLETPAGVSGSRLSRVDIFDERGETARYVLKRISSEWDWIMRATDDSCGREEELSNVLDGWDAFPAVVEPDVATLIQALHEDSGPLCAALTRYPHTLIHGDYKLANLGIQRGGRSRVILLDWASVGIAPPAVDLAWYLGLAALRLPISKDEAIDVYRRRLALRLGNSFDPAWWLPQLSLGLLGGLLRFGYWLAWLAARRPRDDLRAWAQGELRWWSTHARAGAGLL